MEIFYLKCSQFYTKFMIKYKKICIKKIYEVIPWSKFCSLVNRLSCKTSFNL